MSFAETLVDAIEEKMNEVAEKAVENAVEKVLDNALDNLDLSENIDDAIKEINLDGMIEQGVEDAIKSADLDKLAEDAVKDVVEDIAKEKMDEMTEEAMERLLENDAFLVRLAAVLEKRRPVVPTFFQRVRSKFVEVMREADFRGRE